MTGILLDPYDVPGAGGSGMNAVLSIWSPEQILLSLSVLMLVTRGSLNTNESLSKYWPEHIPKGEKDDEVRHLLSRGSGVFGCYDGETIKHISELIRRIDGRSLEQFLAEEFADVYERKHYQQVADAQARDDGSPRPRLREGCNSNGLFRDKELAHMESFYPESIPAHRLHPRAHHFSVVNQSSIGKALLTHRHWRQGDFMARFDGVTVPEVMLHTLQKTVGVHIWDPHFIGNLAHSCNPNVMLDMTENEMWAIQDIESGAVLTMDYASTEDYLFRTFKCKCSALSCRGEVTGRKQRNGSDLGNKLTSNLQSQS